jgi:hypothetical protein
MKDTFAYCIPEGAACRFFYCNQAMRIFHLLEEQTSTSEPVKEEETTTKKKILNQQQQKLYLRELWL